MFINILLLIIGFVILIKGADVFVDGASSVASNFKLPKILIGLTIVAFGTSAPEFAVSVKSMISGTGDMVLGNVIGSNIINVLLIVGIASIINPLHVKKDTVRKELPMVLLITMIFNVLVCDTLFKSGSFNNFTRSDGIVIVLVFLVFLYYLLSIAFKDRGVKEVEKAQFGITKSILFTILGIGAIILGSNFVVDSASYIAKNMGISERIIALTVVAFGTSLPELVTTIVASKKNETDIAVGNIIGSNIFNICFVVGIPVAIFGGISAVSFTYIDLIILLFSSMILWLFTFKDHTISRKEGLLILIVFVLYYSWILI